MQHATIDDLARMINEGFKTTATKDDLTALEDRLTARLDTIEKHILTDYGQRIERLEIELKRLKVWPSSRRPTGSGTTRKNRHEAMAVFLFLTSFLSPAACRRAFLDTRAQAA